MPRRRRATGRGGHHGGDRGQRAGRTGQAAALYTIDLVIALAQHAAAYARPDLIAGGAIWLVALVTMVLIFARPSNIYYRQAARPWRIRPGSTPALARPPSEPDCPRSRLPGPAIPRTGSACLSSAAW